MYVCIYVYGVCICVCVKRKDQVVMRVMKKKGKQRNRSRVVEKVIRCRSLSKGEILGRRSGLAEISLLTK